MKRMKNSGNISTPEFFEGLGFDRDSLLMRLQHVNILYCKFALARRVYILVRVGRRTHLLFRPNFGQLMSRPWDVLLYIAASSSLAIHSYKLQR